MTKPVSTNPVHDHYVRCECEALYSDPITKCPACGEPNPELVSADTQPAPSRAISEKP